MKVNFVHNEIVRKKQVKSYVQTESILKIVAVRAWDVVSSKLKTKVIINA